MRIRAVAILIEDDQVALIERYRAGRHYFTFPGGGVDEGETVEQAIIREVEEELGLHIAIERKVADVWFRGNRQEYFLVRRLGGKFGAGTGEEYTDPRPDDPDAGTYLPVWMPILDILSQPVVPVEVAEMALKSRREGWPAEPVIIYEEEK